MFAIFASFAFIALAFWDISAFMDNSRRGLLLFSGNVLPVLFPFFFITSLLVELDLFKKGTKTSVAILSYIGGYPTGAKMLSELYNRGQISRSDAIKTATFTSTCSPVFVIATVGTVFYQNTALGVVIFVAHLAGALLNGLIYRKVDFAEKSLSHPPSATQPPPYFKGESHVTTAISTALYSSVQNILAVGGLIVIFFIAAAPFGTGIAAILEMTNGVYRASQSSFSFHLSSFSYLLPCAIISFGGLCVAMQGFVFLKNFHTPFWFYLLYKVTHTIIAVALCFFICLVF